MTERDGGGDRNPHVKSGRKLERERGHKAPPKVRAFFNWFFGLFERGEKDD